MCGIFGYLDRAKRPLSLEALQTMAGKIAHRGPDHEGIWHQPQRGIGMGNRLLAIIGVGSGQQPLVSEDGQVAVVQNGEIFNYVELAAELRTQGVSFKTASDTEVILRLYERHGIGFVSKLNGMFAIAIDDARSGEFHLIRDRIGVKPLYIADDGTRLVFGSEIKAMLPVLPKPRMDLEAIHHYLTFNYVPPPWTAFAGIKHLMPGHVLTVKNGQATTRRWWSLAEQRERALQESDFSAWAEEFLDILDDATRIRLRADVPFGAFLSGGVDSSTIVGLMTRHTPQPVKTFCIGFADPRFDESRFAQAAADRFATQHTMEVAELNMLERWPHCIYHCDQPHGDASFMPTLRVSELAAKHVKVVLTGDGGDELFAGYDKYANFFANPANAALSTPDFQRRYFESVSLFNPGAKAALYQPQVANQLAGVDSFAAAAKPWFDESQHFDRTNQALYLDMQLLLSGNNLVKPDRMGMAVSIEARTPFLDWRMMEFAFRSPGFTKLAGEEKKRWFKQAVTPLIGRELAYRPKQMFTVPVGEWFRVESANWLSKTLDRSSLLAGVFNPARMRTMLAEHQSGSNNHTRELRALAALAMWGEQFEVTA